MKRQLWNDERIEARMGSWADLTIEQAELLAWNLLCQLRDDLTRRLISTQRAAWRLLRINAELRERVANQKSYGVEIEQIEAQCLDVEDWNHELHQRVGELEQANEQAVANLDSTIETIKLQREHIAELEAENARMAACAKDDGEMLRMMNEAIAELENIETDLKAQLAAASQAEREWRDAEKELPDKWRDVEVRHIGWLRDNGSWAVLEQGYPTAWRPLPAQGEGANDEQR